MIGSHAPPTIPLVMSIGLAQDPASTARPQVEAMFAFVRAGDTVVVHSMDRLAERPR